MDRVLWAELEQRREDAKDVAVWAVVLWNAKVPEGTSVRLREDDGSFTETRTRSDAWVLGSGMPVVLVEGRTGGYLLYRIQPMEAS